MDRMRRSSRFKMILGGFAAVIFYLIYLFGIRHASNTKVSTAEHFRYETSAIDQDQTANRINHDFVYSHNFKGVYTKEHFGARIPQGKVINKAIAETSGIAVSGVHRDVLYTHNDKGDSSRFFAVDIKTGSLLATFEVKDIANYDWEDFAYGPCIDDCKKNGCSAAKPPSRYCIYIADIGDHGGKGAKNNIYMVREPRAIKNSSIEVVDTLMFRWTEIDAETLMISPGGKLFVISKVEGGHAVMASLPSSAWGKGRVRLDMKNAASLRLNTTQNDPKAEAISPNGKEMVLVAEEGAYYYSVPNEDYLNVAGTTVPEKLKLYEAEPRTEAVSWSPDGQGFYVMAEGDNQTIYFFPKIKD